MNKDYKIYQMDCLDFLKDEEDKKYDLIIIDPPYNIGVAEWDKIKNYTDWMVEIFKEVERVLKDTGSFYFFHQDIPQIARLQVGLEQNTDLLFKRMIIWNKYFDESNLKSFLDYHLMIKGARNYNQFTEYCFYYVKGTPFNKEGVSAIYHKVDNFKELRQYFDKVQKFIGKNIREINSILGHRRAEHIFYINSTQWNLCTEKTYNQLIEVFGIDKMDGFLEWEVVSDINEKEKTRLKEGKEKYRYTFNPSGEHNDVWEFSKSEEKNHITPKPIGLLEKIIKHSSNEGDLVLDFFMGSGSTGEAALKLNRRFVGVERDEKHFNVSKNNLENIRR